MRVCACENKRSSLRAIIEVRASVIRYVPLFIDAKFVRNCRTNKSHYIFRISLKFGTKLIYSDDQRLRSKRQLLQGGNLNNVFDGSSLVSSYYQVVQPRFLSIKCCSVTARPEALGLKLKAREIAACCIFTENMADIECGVSSASFLQIICYFICFFLSI